MGVHSTYSVSFDGANDYVTAAGPAFGSGDFTVSAWVKPTDFNFNRAIYDTLVIGGVGVRANDVVWFVEQTTGCLKGFSANGFVTAGTTALTTGAWNHVAFVRSGTTLTYYVNGSAAGTATFTTNITGAHANIGCFADVPNGTGTPFLNWLGNIDDLRVFNVALSGADVAALYAGTDFQTNLVDYWPFEEGTGTTTADTVGGNTGTLTNGPTWSTDVPSQLQGGAANPLHYLQHVAGLAA